MFTHMCRSIAIMTYLLYINIMFFMSSSYYMTPVMKLYPLDWQSFEYITTWAENLKRHLSKIVFERYIYLYFVYLIYFFGTTFLFWINLPNYFILWLLLLYTPWLYQVYCM